MTSPWSLAAVWEAVADAVPEQEAMVAGDRRLTYRQADERANRLARALADRGVGEGSWVGLHLRNGTEYLEGMLAAYKLRAVPVNVNFRYVADELRYLFTDADLAVVLTEPDLEPVVEEVRGDCPLLQHVLVRGEAYEAALAEQPATRLDVPGRGGDDRYVLYTGGTTGMPKGVLWRHEDIFFGAFGGGGQPPAASLEELQERVRAAGGAERMLPLPPFMHGAAHWRAFATIAVGGCCVIDVNPKLDPADAWRLVDEERVTFLLVVGDAFARPLLDWLAAHRSEVDLASLQLILSGGAILSPALKAQFAELLPAATVIDGFGASETGGQGAMAGAAAGSNPRFAMDASTTVLDELGQRAAPGEVGRLARTGHIPLGYHKDPVKTEATFPTLDGVRWAVPGDAARLLEDGTIEVLGRGSVSINTGGEKVFPEEVEAALKGHPAVFDAVVVGVRDERWGERVTAVIKVREGHEAPGPEALAEHCRASIAGYKVPRGVVVVDEVVRSPSGKPDYRWAKSVATGAG